MQYKDKLMDRKAHPENPTIERRETHQAKEQKPPL